MKTTTLLSTLLSSSTAPLNLVTNGTFDADASWTKDAGWTIAGGVATCAASDVQIQQGNLVLKQPMVNGQSYRLKYTVKAGATGSIIARIGNSFLTAHSAAGTYEESGTYDNQGSIAFYSISFRGDIDDVELYANP